MSSSSAGLTWAELEQRKWKTPPDLSIMEMNPETFERHQQNILWKLPHLAKIDGSFGFSFPHLWDIWHEKYPEQLPGTHYHHL